VRGRKARVADRPCGGDRVGIAVERDEPSAPTEAFQDQAAVTASAEGRVHEGAVGAGVDGKRVDCRVEEDGNVRIGDHSEKFSVPGAG